jgi:hypothetical protein
MRYASVIETPASGVQFWLPFLVLPTPASEKPVVAPFPTPASLTRQRNQYAGVRFGRDVTNKSRLETAVEF